MAEMLRNGVEMRWSSMGPAEKRLYAGALGCIFIGSGMVGFLAGVRTDGAVAVWQALLPLLPIALGLWLWTRLQVRQDELHRRMGAHAARTAYWITLAVGIPVGLVEGLAGHDLLPTWGLVLVTLLGGGIGWMLAARKHLGPEEAAHG